MKDPTKSKINIKATIPLLIKLAGFGIILLLMNLFNDNSSGTGTGFGTVILSIVVIGTAIHVLLFLYVLFKIIFTPINYKELWIDNVTKAPDNFDNGYAECSFKDSSDTYYGHFKNKIRSGNGKYSFAKGDSYEGEWKDDEMHGNGTYTYVKKKKKEGVWENGKFIK